MVLFIILGVIVLITLVVLGFLFFMLSKEGKKNTEEKVVPLTDLTQLKKELSSAEPQAFGMKTRPLEPPKPGLSAKDPTVIPPFEAKVAMPTQPVLVPLEDVNYKKRAQELEEELRSISQKAEGQSDEAKKMIESLSQENEALKFQKANLEQAQQKLTEIQAEASGLKTENINLQTQLESTDAKVRLLEEQMTAVKIQMGEEISRANATVSELNREKELLLSAPRPDPDAALRQELEALKSEQLQLKQKYDELERDHQKLRELNVNVMEKNDSLEYELVKARAQSSGLERVSFDYKIQIEDFLKKVNAAQAANDQLSQVKNQLETMVDEVKNQNEELVKKDQLAQFELEKNRSRLVALERENEVLKSRAQQGNQ